MMISPACKHGESRGSFTLVELLLVIAVMAVLAALAVPYFVRSMRGNRLRTAARTAAESGRYARSMAVLKQKRMTLSFDFKKPAVRVSEMGGSELLKRKLDRVKIDYVRLADAEKPLKEGTAKVTYDTNGTCTPYTVRVEDQHGDGITIEVDALSSVRTVGE
ncbi:MAG: prepilin-type N-terminal cleavage/methylation domain-containing protein [Kiritimatiellia bacterium]